MFQWIYSMPADSISWEYSKDSPFTRGVRNTLASGLSETLRSSVLVILYRLWLNRTWVVLSYERGE